MLRGFALDDSSGAGQRQSASFPSGKRRAFPVNPDAFFLRLMPNSPFDRHSDRYIPLPLIEPRSCVMLYAVAREAPPAVGGACASRSGTDHRPHHCCTRCDS